MKKYPFEKCKDCLHPVRVVDIHGKTVECRCYFQLDTMKEYWSEDDCAHFFEPRKKRRSELGEALEYMKNKRKQCPDDELWFPYCRRCSEWYDCYEDDSMSQEPACYCISYHDEMEHKRLMGEKDCPYKNEDR